MNYIQCDMKSLIETTAKEYAAILLVGPRQVGKSTILEHIFPHVEKVTLDEFQERSFAKRDPELFLKLHSSPIMIYPIEIKKTNQPNLSMVKAFRKLESSSIPMGNGAIICTKEDLSALERNLFIIPIWMI